MGLALAIALEIVGGSSEEIGWVRSVVGVEVAVSSGLVVVASVVVVGLNSDVVLVISLVTSLVTSEV